MSVNTPTAAPMAFLFRLITPFMTAQHNWTGSG